MVKGLVSICTRTSSLLRKVLQMAENTTLNVGEKRAAQEADVNAKTKKKKKEHIVTLGKSEGCKRKVALLVAYNGNGYYGVQINRGFKTIESELFSALVKAGAVPQEHVDDTSKMWFQRGSRTDKGVSAVGQTFSLKIIPDVVSKLNEHLSEQIRVMGYVRTTNGFDAKNFCCGRTYMYMTPTFAFAPLEKFITDEYRTTEDRLEHLRRLLKMYVGTHKFHNFTSGVKYEQANASRYIMNFECSDPYVREGIEFVTLRVKGQSFMLHQIRKMIGLTMAILRGYCTENALTKSWQPERVDIPKAPGLGLVLEALHFDGYNKKFGSDGIHDPIDWTACKETMEDFKEKYIISDIVEQEKKDRVMLNWLQTLQFHNFDQTRPEGPQKPWVRTEKLLRNKSKDSESNLASNSPSENKLESDIKDQDISQHAEADASTSKTETATANSKLDTQIAEVTRSNSDTKEENTDNVVDNLSSDFTTDRNVTEKGESEMEADSSDPGPRPEKKIEIIADSGAIVSDSEPSSTDAELAQQKEVKS